MKSQKHAEFIHAWADGAEIECRGITNHPWEDCVRPAWYEFSEYRIKPEPKPDLVKYSTVENKYSVLNLSRSHFDDDNLKITFDGETGKLKSAEVIK